jgi:DNA anti-recombination protein RmuC
MGASTGTLVGAAFDLTRAGISDDYLTEVSSSLLPGTAAVIGELDEDWQAPIDTRMEALGGHVFRRNWIAVEDAYYAKQIAADRAELAALEAELAKASAEQKARLEARIEDARHKLRDIQDRLKARIESTRREGDAKIASLQQQLATARDERKQRLEKRLTEVRADYRERSDKLNQAWELTKSALT